MFVIEADRSKRLMVISYSARVTAEEAKRAGARVRELLADFNPGFRVLTDMRWLISMESAAAPHIAKMMNAVAAKKASMIVRVVPDPSKDIGFNILSLFHYDDSVKIFTFETLADAVRILAADLDA